MNRLFMLLLVLGWGSLNAPEAQAQTFRLGIFQSEPGMWQDPNGQPRGAYVDYFRMLAQRMGVVDLRIEAFPLKRLLSDLETGDLDASLLLIKNPDREKLFTFPSTPLLWTRTGLAVRRSGPVKKVVTAEDLVGVRIGYTAGAVLSPFLQNANLQIGWLFQLNAAESEIRQLAAGRIDAVFSPDVQTISYYIRKYGDPKTMEVLPLPENPVPWYTAFSRAGGKRWAAAYEKALADQAKVQSLDEFFASWNPAP